jgi:hypothetical protein
MMSSLSTNRSSRWGVVDGSRGATPRLEVNCMSLFDDAEVITTVQLATGGCRRRPGGDFQEPLGAIVWWQADCRNRASVWCDESCRTAGNLERICPLAQTCHANLAGSRPVIYHHDEW